MLVIRPLSRLVQHKALARITEACLAIIATSARSKARAASRLEARSDERSRHARQGVRLRDPVLVDRSGRVVKTTGDGFLAEFGSVVSAVQAAIELQVELGVAFM